MHRIFVIPVLFFSLTLPAAQEIAMPKPRVFADFSAAILNVLSPRTSPRFPTTLPKIQGADIQLDHNAVYDKSFFEASSKMGFDPKEMEAMLANRKKVTAVPDIMNRLKEDATRRDTAQYAKDKADLVAWRNYYRNGFEVLKGMPVSEDASTGHLKLLGWMRYNVDFLNAVTQRDLSAKELTLAANTYRKTFYANHKDISSNFSGIDPSSWNSLFVRQASAQTGIPFGGIIAITDVCTTGELITVTGPAPGAFFLYWTVYAINPFLYNLVVDGNWILGVATPGPGFCNKGYVNYTEGEGFIQYFGTSLEP